ncbi:MAG: hypothetical protein ACOZQL_12745 [Myxococcota bacterium]
MKKRLPLLIALGVGAVLWKTGGFGFFPTERTLVWRFPGSYGEVRRVELQVWEGETLIKRSESTWAAGLVGEPTLSVPLTKGPHRAIASVTNLRGELTGYQREFDPGGDETIVLEMKKP